MFCRLPTKYSRVLVGALGERADAPRPFEATWRARKSTTSATGIAVSTALCARLVALPTHMPAAEVFPAALPYPDGYMPGVREQDRSKATLEMRERMSGGRPGKGGGGPRHAKANAAAAAASDSDDDADSIAFTPCGLAPAFCELGQKRALT